MRRMLAVLLLVMVALGAATERTIRLEDKVFTLEVNASAVKAYLEDARPPLGASGVKSVPQSNYEEFGIVPLRDGGGDEYWSDSAVVADGYSGSWKSKIYYSYTAGSPKSTQLGGYTRRSSAPNEVYYIELQFAYRMNFLKWADWEAGSKWLHTGAAGHRIGYNYRYPKDTNKSDSQTQQWDDGYGRLFKFFTGHCGYVPNQPGDYIWHNTHDKSVAKPDGRVYE